MRSETVQNLGFAVGGLSVLAGLIATGKNIADGSDFNGALMIPIVVGLLAIVATRQAKRKE